MCARTKFSEESTLSIQIEKCHIQSIFLRSETAEMSAGSIKVVKTWKCLIEMQTIPQETSPQYGEPIQSNPCHRKICLGNHSYFSPCMRQGEHTYKNILSIMFTQFAKLFVSLSYFFLNVAYI